MRKNLKPHAYIYPLPVLIIGTYDENGVPNAMNAAWGTVSDEAQVSICISSTHKTMKNILKNKVFTLSIADEKNVVSADYVGIVSGNKEVDKIKNAGWTHQKGDFTNAPIFNELPLCMECQLVSYDKESEICVGKVINVCVDDSILDSKGKINLTKFKPICYDCGGHGYYVLGERVGNAFKDGLKLK